MSEIPEHESDADATYSNLLHRAHHGGLSCLTATLLQAPDDSNQQTAIVLAEAIVDDRRFSAIGDASASVERLEGMTPIARAELRAKSRTLADALDLPQASSGEREAASSGESQEDVLDRSTSISTSPPVSGDGAPARNPGESDASGEPATPNQLATIGKLCRLLGLEASEEDRLNTVQASARIAELARRFNEQGSVATRRGGSR
ncbi:MAG TPA: hypothetical protein VFB34_13620 [Chloroflexota bacterium]|nr:hypothetical protein [Chloroflexota bacterium]